MSPGGQWIDVGEAATLASDGRLEVELDGFYVAVVELDGILHAFEDRCTHDGEPLSGADLESDASTPCGVVICPRHGAKFCLRTGNALTPPAYEPLKVFEVRKCNGRIEVQYP
ncbi:MAG: Rieske 2Fe-2S domain-containing protein [Gammaproteobacteria bacterium]|nr:Rieske 2Fe-2S domain-containing protein [Gammaproteobacteria bacterium]